MASGSPIWILVLSYNGLEDTRKCLASVAAAVRPGVTTLLIDNGSTDGTAAAVASEFPWCRVHTVAENRGPAAGNNAGIQVALESGCQWMLLLNNDTTVDPLLVERLQEAVEAHPEYSVVGPVIYYMGDPDVVMTDGCVFNAPDYHGFFQRRPVPLTQSRPPAITEVDVVNACCMMVRADVFQRIGQFDESMFIYHDETDLCLRAQSAGFKAGVIDHALIWHKGSATFQTTGKRMGRYYDARNLLYLLRKHHGARRNGRTRIATSVMYVKYMFYWFCAESEAGHAPAAAAVVEGMCDGLSGTMGRYQEGRRRLAAPLRGMFELLRRRPGKMIAKATP
jgi:hypothetical protein